ncbi:MAG: Sec-independent protein translocase subunit TatA [Ornithinimicrobium sp.]
MFRNIQGWQFVIIVLAIVILIGWKRLPDMARSVGRSMRIFKSEVEQMTTKPEDDRPSAASTDTVDGERRSEPVHREQARTEQARTEQARTEQARSDDTQPDHDQLGHHRRDDDIERSGTDERNN